LFGKIKARVKVIFTEKIPSPLGEGQDGDLIGNKEG